MHPTHIGSWSERHQIHTSLSMGTKHSKPSSDTQSQPTSSRIGEVPSKPILHRTTYRTGPYKVRLFWVSWDTLCLRCVVGWWFVWFWLGHLHRRWHCMACTATARLYNWFLPGHLRYRFQSDEFPVAVVDYVAREVVVGFEFPVPDWLSLKKFP